MAKISGSASANNGWLRKFGRALVSRRACYVYIIGVGIAGGTAFGVFVEAEKWVGAVIGVLIALFFFQTEQIFYFSRQIEDIHPGSSPTREMIAKQSQIFQDFTQNALSNIEDRLLTTIKNLPGLFALVTDPAFQKPLLRIGETVRTTPKQAINVLNRIVAISLEETASDVDSVARSKVVIRNEPEVADARWKAVLEPAAIGQHAVATSWVLPEWWNLNKAWRGENEAAIKKGLQLARIFIAENEQELEANIQVMREQAKQGIQVNWVYADCLRENNLEPRDILVSNCSIPDFDDPDNSQKQLVDGSIFGEQILELGLEADGSKKAGYRMLARRVEISAYPPEVVSARTVIEQIYRLSQRFDDTEWWSYFFDDDYTPITRYKEDTAEHETEMLIKATKLRADMRILDLGCAYGRIEQILEQKIGSVEVIPVECSQQLLNEAMSSAIYGFTRRGVGALDMRKISELYKEEFDVVMSIFTSWGYFRECDNHRMFEKVFAVLKAGGFFYLDIDNPSFIRANTKLVEYKSNSHTIHRCDDIRECEEEDCDGKTVKVTRRLSQFSVVRPDGSTKSKPLVSLRVYELNELQSIASEIGFEFVQAWDENGQEWRTGRSSRAEHVPERMVVVLKKQER